MKSIPRPILIIVLITLAVALYAGLNLPGAEWLRGGFGWRWGYEPALANALPLLIVLAVYVPGAWLALRWRRTFPVLLWALIGSVALALAVVAVRQPDVGYELFARTASGLATGVHREARLIDWQGGEWRTWTQIMASQPPGSHASTTPPGLPALYALLNSALSAAPDVARPLYRAVLPYQCHNYDLLQYTPAEWASAWFGMALPLWAALTVFPLYGAARRLNGEESARQVVLWWALVPGIAAFAASWSTFYPFASVTAFWLLLRGLKQDAHLRVPTDGARKGVQLNAPTNARMMMFFALSGLVIGLGLFLHFVFLPLIALFGLYTLLHLWRERASIRDLIGRCVLLGAAFLAGLALPWLIYALIGGESFFAILSTSLNAHLELERDALFWLWGGVWDWALFSGLGFALVWLFSLIRPPRAMPILSVSLLATVVALAISGSTQGENGRIWLFLSPFVLLTPPSNPLPISWRGGTSWLALTVTQAVMLAVIAITMPVMGTEFTRPTYESSSTMLIHRIDAVFAASEGQAELHTWDGVYRQSEGDIHLRLQWRPLEQMYSAYWFAAFLVAPDGTTTEPVIWRSSEFEPYPTTCWRPSDALILQSVMLPLPENAPSGDYWISLAVFGDEAGPEGRLRVTLPDGTQDVQIGLGPIRVEDVP